MKILFNTVTQLLQPYTNRLGGPIVGLDPIYRVYELTQNERPAHDPAVEHLEAFETIDHTAGTVQRGWQVVENIPPPIPEATPLQVRAFLIRRGISLESIPALIAAVTAEGEEREEALMRWDKTLSFPEEHPLVAAVAAQLELNLDEVWGSILAIE